MISPPRRDEKNKLVALAEGTGFFSAVEVETIARMLDSYFEPGPEDDYAFLVYREHRRGRPLGFACYGPAAMSHGAYDLYWIAVDRAHQNRRIGRSLLEAVEAEVERRQGRLLYIETSDNEMYAPTRAFYERSGYRPAAHLPDFYHPGDGKLIFSKRLATGSQATREAGGRHA